MDSNFQFLREGWPEVFQNAQQAEAHGITAPVTSVFYSRLTLELMVNWLYENDEELEAPYDTALSSRMYERTFREILPPSMYKELHIIRKEGNNAVHTGKTSQYKALAMLKYLHRFLGWCARLYSEERPEVPTFEDHFIPAKGTAEKSRAQLERMQLQVEERVEELQKERRRRLQAEEEAARLKAQLEALQAIKSQNKAAGNVLPPPPMSEKETREIFIDVLLREAGWDIDAPNVREYPVEGLPVAVNKTGRGNADYVLWGQNGKPLAVIEAKRTSKEAYQGQHQAELYANCLERMHGQRPIIFFTNGYENWIWDDTFYSARPISGFLTREELQLLIDRRQSRQDIRTLRPNTEIAGRHYQMEGIQRVMETFAKEADGQLRGGKRAALIVMATGAGKTRTAAAIVELLSKANWVKRVLFLADRSALVKQAKKAFKQHTPHLSAIDLTQEKEETDTRLVFSTYPTMMNRIDGARSGDARLFTPGHFDLIIVDEAHRSVYQKYNAIFEYFDALLLGLTATPKDQADKDTYELFDCEVRNPTFSYDIEEAVRDGYLVPPRGEKVNLGFVRRGIHYNDLSEEEQAEYESTFRDEAGEVPEHIDASAINSWLYNHDTIDKVIDHLMQKGQRVAGGDKMGKSIIFAKNHKHAKLIEQRFDKLYPQYGSKFCRVIDNYDRFAQQLIEDLSDINKYPQIAVSVDMLDTGIDIPELLNLVFFKPVYSRAKYWQMVGRGTRLCPDLFAPGEDKAFFYIFDFCGNLEFFEHNPDGLQTKVPLRLSHRIFQARLQLAQLIKQQDPADTFRQEQLDFCHSAVSALYAQRDHFRIQMKLGEIDPLRDRAQWNDLGDSEIEQITNSLGPLIELDDPDEAAKRFDLLMHELYALRISGDEAQEPYLRKIQRLAGQLAGMHNIPAIQKAMPHIQRAQDAAFLQEATLPELESIRKALRGLLHIIPRRERKVYETNFKDQIDGTEAAEVLRGIESMDNYRQRVERYVRENREHIAIQKLRTNQPITAAELQELERLLFEDDPVAREALEKELGDQPLGAFIRSLVGLDTRAAKEAFADLLHQSQLRADQMTFLNRLIDYLAVNGTIQKRMLMQPPFTDLHDMGIFGIFDDDAERAKIIRIIDAINRNAEAG
ncbi:DEAD/DEAH box helicase family protein [Phaeodactylibacter xiamenensis]|uniref:DEAD/DEAH box helicase family protein n=1 Tax=Phaeodactylibacter xiamenensis TaxID=1524460 RepID=UPI003BA8D91C